MFILLLLSFSVLLCYLIFNSIFIFWKINKIKNTVFAIKKDVIDSIICSFVMLIVLIWNLVLCIVSKQIIKENWILGIIYFSIYIILSIDNIILEILLLLTYLKNKLTINNFINIDFAKMISICNIKMEKKDIKKVLTTKYNKISDTYMILCSHIENTNKNNYIYAIRTVDDFNKKLSFFSFKKNKIIYKLSLYLYFDIQTILKKSIISLSS